MKFELKTYNENYFKSFGYVFKIIFNISLILIFSDIALKIGIVSRHYQIDYNCKVLFVKKSTSNLKKLARISNLKSKQRIWEFCKAAIK